MMRPCLLTDPAFYWHGGFEADTLVRYWLLDEGSGTTLADAKTGDGIADGSATIDASSMTWGATSGMHSKPGLYSINNSSLNPGYACGYALFAGGRTAFTASLWLKPDGTALSTGRGVVFTATLSNSNPTIVEPSFAVTYTDSIAGVRGVTVKSIWLAAGARTISGGTVTDNSWSLVAFSVDIATGTVELYVDGALAASDSVGADAPYITTNTLFGSGFGSFSNGFGCGLNANVWECSVWSSALSAADHLELYNRGVADRRLPT